MNRLKQRTVGHAGLEGFAAGPRGAKAAAEAVDVIDGRQRDAGGTVGGYDDTGAHVDGATEEGGQRGAEEFDGLDAGDRGRNGRGGGDGVEDEGDGFGVGGVEILEDGDRADEIAGVLTFAGEGVIRIEQGHDGVAAFGRLREGLGEGEGIGIEFDDGAGLPVRDFKSGEGDVFRDEADADAIARLVAGREENEETTGGAVGGDSGVKRDTKAERRGGQCGEQRGEEDDKSHEPSG